MKKIILVVMLFIITGCATNIPKEYNDQIERYDMLIDEVYPKAYKNSKDPVLLKTDVALYDVEIREMQDKITNDKVVTKEELEKFTKMVNELEVMIKNG